MKRIVFTLLLLLLAMLIIGCVFLKDNGLPVFQTGMKDGRRIIILPDGRRFKNKRATNSSIEERFSWLVPTYREDLDTHQVGYASGGERIYETEEEYCLLGWAPDSGLGGLYFDESLEFPKPIVGDYGEVVLSIKGEKTILKDEVCIQAFLDRLLTKEYDVKEEAVETTDKSRGTITFYSREYPKLYFYLDIYQDKDKEKYYIEDWSNWDWIECTDLIEQYLSEYFK